MDRLKGKNILITGASSGIGEAIAIRFAQEGARVAINYNRGKDRAEAVKEKVRTASKASNNSLEPLTVQADISDEAQVEKMFSTVLQAFGSLEVLINNSGIQKPTPSHEYSMADFD